MTHPARLLNDGSTDSPRLSVYLNLGNLVGLRSDTTWPGLDGLARYERLQSDGFEGVQLTSDEPSLANMPFAYCGLDRINTPAEAETVAAKHAGRGDSCITVHVGWGIEDDDEVDRLVEAVLEASDKHGLPMFIETHRATITQDLWRTVQITKRFPEVRFNGDFSHYYCGQELVYGDWQKKLAFMEPIFTRTGFMHGRIASPGCIQVSIEADISSKPIQANGSHNYLQHFKELWIRAMLGFLCCSQAGDVMIFAPELLPSSIYYARLFPDTFGNLVEESDRYAQALIYKEIARVCFIEAQQRWRSSARENPLLFDEDSFRSSN